ncbi:hypothetical protein K3495_g12738 [Podosphaera aphanis]|nr:hypothetical protein K3495_g12738 [Podosphaera aphanis]
MTAYNTRYGLFETQVMPFGLSNAPATFQARINEVLRPYLDIFCTAYIDDILIYSDDLPTHRTHVNTIIYALGKAGLHCDIKKCEFEVTKVTYLGLIISTTGINVQEFLGFANFYRRFIKNFSEIVRPLVSLTQKDVNFIWLDACQQAFQSLQKSFTSAPVLRHFDASREVFVEADSSDFVSAGILSRMDNNGELHPVAFMSKKLENAECNYEIYDKELLAIVPCLEGWRAELQGSHTPITVFTDHRNLEYFMTTKELSRRQVRLSEFLSQFDFVIKSRPGRDNVKADSLTRRSQDLPKNNSDPRVQYQRQTLLPPDKLDPSVIKDFKTNDTSLNSNHDTYSCLYPAILAECEEPLDQKIT